MAVRLSKPWQALTEENVESVPGQLGVYELADEREDIVFIGNADARSLFGLKGELIDRIGQASFFRLEVTTAYRTRCRELLMAYHADMKVYPPLNTEEETRDLGRLSPG